MGSSTEKAALESSVPPRWEAGPWLRTLINGTGGCALPTQIRSQGQAALSTGQGNGLL